MAREVILVADIGGTRLRVAAVAAGVGEGPPAWLRREQQPTPRAAPTAGLLRALQAVRPPGARVARVALAVAGFVDAARGEVLLAPNIPGWRDEPLAARVQAALAAPVVVLNDANAAALGEATWGAGRGHRAVLFVTVSTGVGGGWVVDGRIWGGARGLAGEVGHLTVDPAGPRCSCGQPGHLEAMASGWAIAQAARQATGRAWEAHQVAAAAHRGEPWARQVLTRAGAALGRALADLSHVLTPDIIILGGGVTRSGPLWWQAVQQTYARALMHPAFAAPVRAAALGDDAGLVGAWVAARQHTAPHRDA